jgi:hypothetical protein
MESVSDEAIEAFVSKQVHRVLQSAVNRRTPKMLLRALAAATSLASRGDDENLHRGSLITRWLRTSLDVLRHSPERTLKIRRFCCGRLADSGLLDHLLDLTENWTDEIEWLKRSDPTNTHPALSLIGELTSDAIGSIADLIYTAWHSSR